MAPRPRVSLRLATGAVVGLWLPYTVLNTVFPGPILTYILGMGVALASTSILGLAGMTRGDRLLRAGSVSRAGVWCTAGILGTAPAAAVAGLPHYWGWIDLLLYAPASAVAQELYFRGALLPALVRLCRPNVGRGLALQALLFALWHARLFRIAPAPVAAAAVAGTFVVGLAWRWQALRERTELYTALQHTLFLAIF